MKKSSFIFLLSSLFAVVAGSQVYRIVESFKEDAFLDLFEDGKVIIKNVNYQITSYGLYDKFVLQSIEQKIYSQEPDSKTHYKVMDSNQQMKTMWERTIFNSEVRLMREFDAIIEVTSTPDWSKPNKVKLYDLKTGEFKIAYQTDLNPYSKERPLGVQVSWFNIQMRPTTHFVLIGADEKVVTFGDYVERMHFTIYDRGVRRQYALRHGKDDRTISFEGFTCENIYLVATLTDISGSLTVTQRSPDYIAITSALPLEGAPEISGFDLHMTCLGMDLSVPVVSGRLETTKTRGLNAGFELVPL